MRLHYVAHVIAAALAASAYGLQAVPDAANLSPLQTSTKAQHQTSVAEKTERFLASDDKDLPLMVTSTEPLLSAQQEGGAGRQLRADYEKGNKANNDWQKMSKYNAGRGNLPDKKMLKQIKEPNQKIWPDENNFGEIKRSDRGHGEKI
uniref:RxLR effector candidate protein n=1 Tax=Hyaloperonospora arabidopsidis (strain Emoy2) TaxID=559515 RepID=M4BNB8_HYAAE|nr:RxLR effector candidate protein [Hyaloperonospora arabidopsidis Emoy2]